jgi:hypothetical protein
LGRGTDIGAGFRHFGTTRTGPNDHPHTADTGQMTRPLPADRIAENGQPLAADETNQDPGRPGSWLLIRKARIGALFASLSSHCSAIGLAFKARG